MKQRNLAYLLGEVRELTQTYKSGDQESFEAFRRLASLLLTLTVLKGTGTVRLTEGLRENTAVLGGRGGPTDPLPLNDGRYLRLVVTLFLASTAQGRRLKVEEASYQYQIDKGGKQWVFRYDYRREPPEPRPAAHLQIRGKLTEACLPPDTPLARVHFPVGRFSLESVIRLLIQEFGVRTNSTATLWKPVLAESERGFLAISHRPLSGPES